MKKKGVALLLALFTLVLASLLAISFMDLTTTDLQITDNLYRKNQALYLADAGVEYAIYQLRNDKNWNKTKKPIDLPSGSGNTYSVTYSSTSGTITSVGALNSGPQVTLEAKVSVSGSKSPYTVKTIYWREL
jgi:Tfp pilus assembly protein PilX